jgi:hypothetical protein
MLCPQLEIALLFANKSAAVRPTCRRSLGSTKGGWSCSEFLGRSNSFNVRNVLWVCDELDIPFERENLNFERPNLPAVAAYYEALSERAAYRHVSNGLP